MDYVPASDQRARERTWFFQVAFNEFEALDRLRVLRETSAAIERANGKSGRNKFAQDMGADEPAGSR